ncbi:MAG: hypothetical protein RRY78_00620 [Clostridia bacterium]
MKNFRFFKTYLKHFFVIVNGQKAISICVLLCLVMCNIAQLYAINFAYRISYTNSNCKYIVEVENLKLNDVVNKTKKLNKNDFYEVAYNLGNGLYATSSLSDKIIFSGKRIDGEKQILSTSSHSLNKVVELGGEKFTVVGECSGSYEYYIDLKYVSDKYSVEQVILDAKVIKIKSVESDLRSIFSDYQILKLFDKNIYKNFFATPIFYIFLFLFLLSIIAIAICVKYILQKSASFFKTYKLCGAKLKDVILSSVIILGVICCLIFISSDLIYFGLEGLLVQDSEKMFLLPYKLKFNDYFIFNIFYLLIMLPIYGAFIYKYSAKEVEIKRYE